MKLCLFVFFFSNGANSDFSSLTREIGFCVNVQSLCVYMQSYVGKVTLVVMSAKHIIPDPEKITQYCIDALEEMKLAALSLKV